MLLKPRNALMYRVFLHESMMENDKPVSPHLANSQPCADGLASIAPPTCETFTDGQSVENVPMPNIPSISSSLHWFVVRATRGRAKQVYDEIVGLNSPAFEVYLPSTHREAFLIKEGVPGMKLMEEPLFHGLVFVRTTREEFIKLVRALDPYPFINGLTPYYDHFHEYEAGRNEYLVVPDRQFQNFRTIIESGDHHILVDQDKMPAYLNGKKVEVTSGPFAGVRGKLFRWKGLRRVFIKLDHIGTFATGFIRSCDFRILE